ncbi:hypothetical protein PPL_01735 [Heterostelium album PN500]|uniref:Uncharacterized protein n=1 Tax=Heterostelium pallidum (strain ATCC 26659 / Pp 5 / PN500) TaxID=670386 RepID=D3B0B9_HETP5|nr:hypothetical protein PPL_01735 [Heterostelium album PN500]EFA84743.1 hypothetical protein PPL_01735 [Heterostelium album PN500]|eukprot:XP_020436855.1 hypothetical protein PPL_01735 [Heterostelium album PN500]
MFFFVTDRLSCIFLIGATGIPWAVVMVLPFTLVGMGSSPSESGFHMGELNIFVVIPQLLVSLGISFIISLFHNDVVSSLLTGAISSLIATLLVFRIIIPHEIRPKGVYFVFIGSTKFSHNSHPSYHQLLSTSG